MPRLPDPISCSFLILVVFVTIAGCESAPSADPSLEAQASTVAEPPSVEDRPAVRAVSVMQQELRRTTAQPATVHAMHQAELKARVGGYVKQLNADIGDVVQEGDVLAMISVPELEKRRAVVAAQVRRSQAHERQAESGVELAQAMIRSAEAKRAQSRSELARAEASLSAAEAEFQRTSDLVARQSLQQRVLDEVTMRRDAERASLQAAQSAVQSTEADVTVAHAKHASAVADLGAAQADTEIAQQELEEADVQLAYAEIRAPFSGIVTERHIDPGDLVTPDDNSPATPPLFVVSQLDQVRIHIPVPEADAAWVNREDPVRLTFPAFPDEAIDATVTRVSGALDAATRTMLVECVVENPDRKWVPGMFVMATITLATEPNVAVLPSRSIRFDENGKAFVYALQSDETVSIVEVVTGVDEGSWIEIRSPLKPGQRVVDAHLDRFQNGQALRVLSSQ
jgi:HlyD family secretion protein